MFRRLQPSGPRFVYVLLGLAFVVTLAGFSTRRLTAALSFTPGNLALLVTNGTGNNVTASIVEIGSGAAGAAIQTIALPDTTNATDSYRTSASATSTGYVSSTNDRSLLTFTGHNSLNTAANANTLNPRGVYTVDSAGSVVKQTTYTAASGNQTRSATSLNDTNWYIADQGGLYTNGSTSASPSGNFRAAKSFGGVVYLSQASGTATTIQVVTASAASGGTVTGLPGLTNNASLQDFYLVQSGDHGSTYDILYVLSATSNTVGTIAKYSLVDTNGSAVLGDAGDLWTANGTYPTTFGGFGLAAADSGSGELLYISTGQGAQAANSVLKVADAAGYNATIAVTTANNVTLYTTPAGTVIKGLDFAPVSGTGTTPVVSLSVSTNSASETAQTVVTVTATASAPVAGDQTVSLTVGGSGITAGDYTLSSTTITILNGTTTGSATFTVVDDAAAEGTETAILTIGSPSAGIVLGSPATQNLTIADNDSAPACTTTPTPIHSIQGSGNAAAITGTVTARGVIVGDYEGASPALRGFYLQELVPDGDAATSEGIFVFESNNNTTFSVGQVVQVTGAVQENFDETEIIASTIESCDATASVAPADVTLPVPAPANGVPYLERFEGMLVRFHQTLYVSEHFQLGRFGQIVMSSGSRLPQPTNIAAPGAPAQAQQAANDLNKIIVDDETNSQNPDPIRFGRGGNPLSALNTLRGGDTAADIVGVMTYGWAGNAASGNAYRLRPINALGGGSPAFQPTNPRPASPPGVGGRLKVVGMNVLNYFLTLDNGQSICGPIGSKQQCRGAETATELARQQQKLNQALIKLDGDVIGMSELENTQDAQGHDANPPADIIARLNTSLGGDIYGYVDTGVIGTDTIRVGIIYKKAKVTPAGVPLVDNNPVHNRPPVAQSFTEISTGERFSLVVNHFKSKGSCPAVSGPDADQGDGQGCWNATRVQQAQALASFVSGTVVPAASDPDVLLVGDFNSYAKEDPVRALETSGFTNLVARFSGVHAYSYVFDGQWGYLDHGLASTSLLSQVTGAGDDHINADEPSVLDYNTNFKTAGQIASLFNADEFRIADHDPVVIGLALQPLPQANPDQYTVEAGTTLTVSGAQGLQANDTGGPLAIVSHTNTSHGTLTLNADGSFTYTPAPGFTGVDSFDYSVGNATPRYSHQLYSSTLPPLATIGGVKITSGAFGSALVRVPGSSDEVYGLTDRGPNVDGPNGTKIEPIPSFTPMIGKFKLLPGGEAELEQVIPLLDAAGNPYSGRVNTQASTGETITDLNGNVLAPDPNGYDPEGLVALADGTFWVSDEYGPFITHFDATGRQIGRLSPFDGSLPAELNNRIVNRGMEGLTITADGTMLVGIMQSALQQADLAGFDGKRLTPLRIVTYTLATGALHEYLYLLDNPDTTKTAVSEIAGLSNNLFLVAERDANFPPGAYKKLHLIDITGATDVGPNSAVPGAIYNPAGGGLLVGGSTIENLLRNGNAPQNTTASIATLAGHGITPVSKSLYFDLGGFLTNLDPQGRVFSHDKVEGVFALNGGATLVISNDSDFGIDGVTNAAPPFQLRAKISPATGQQDDGEFLVLDLIRSTATVTINVVDTIAPDTVLDSTPSNPTNTSTAGFLFHGTDSGSGVASFECALDGAAFAVCSSGVSYSVSDGSHTFAVQAIDGVGNVDPTPASYTWIVDATGPVITVPADISAEATSPAGATVSFTASAVDAVAGPVPVACAPASGSVFGFGSTTVMCTASDGHGNTSSRSFHVTVADTRAPVLTLPGTIMVNAPTPAGVRVTYSASAADVVDGSVPVTCTPPSGNMFLVGTTEVACSATDHHGNTASGRFTVVVKGKKAAPSF
jgi:predicted extracellular nuclease